MVLVAETNALATLRHRLRGQRAGEVEVTDVRAEYLLDEDAEEYLAVTLVLSDPPTDREIWPLEDVYDLRMQARAEAARLDFSSRLAFRVRTRDDYDDGWTGR